MQKKFGGNVLKNVETLLQRQNIDAAKLLVKKYAKNGEAAGDLIGNKTADKNYINKQSKTQK